MTISEFEQRLSFAQPYCKAYMYDQLYDEPEQTLQPPPVANLWRRGSSSSASSALPSVVEDPEAEEEAAKIEARKRVPFERAWW